MNRRLRGFTLAEMMLAMIILGIGAAMAAALFATAIKQSQGSVNSVQGTIICDNALALAEAMLRADTPGLENNTFGVVADENTFTAIPLASQHYAGGNAMGFVLLGRMIADNGDGVGEGYELIAVSYAKKDAGNTVTLQTIRGTLSGDIVKREPCTFQVSADMENVRLGSPLIRPGGGFAVIVAVDKDAGTVGLDRYFAPPDPDVPSWPEEQCFVIVESGVPLQSPALSVVSRRIMLE